MDPATELGCRLRYLRQGQGLSLRDLAGVAHYSKSSLGDWETGAKVPPAEAAACLDSLLCGDGSLVRLREAAERAELFQEESERISGQLMAAGAGEMVTQFDSATSRLAVDYLSSPGADLMGEINAARREALTALRARRLRNHHQIRYLLGDVGYLSGILAYAALDDGHPRAALAHCDAAWAAANSAGSDQLRAWVRGTQSLILRFLQRYPEALAHAQDGLRYATSGTARARLLAGIGQCKANLDDAAGARLALAQADTAFDARLGADEVNGVFTFSRAKLLYYSGSSLIWLGGGADARLARDHAHTAIELWEDAGVDRSVADEALARVYAATGSLQLSNLEEAAADLEPILSMPAEQRVAWIVKRMDRVAGMLADAPFDTDPLARELLERIKTYS